MPEEVTDTTKAFRQALKKEAGKIAPAIILSAIWSTLLIKFLPSTWLDSDLSMLSIILPWCLIVVWIMGIYGKIRKAFWQQLAFKYGCVYMEAKDFIKEKALLFGIGHSKHISNGIAGRYNDIPFEIFEYNYTVGTGKHKTTYSLTVFEIKFKGSFPHLYLNYKNDSQTNSPSFFSALANLSLPTEFESLFKLYAPKEYEIETLQIFTPDIFAHLIDVGWNHDMEFVDGELIIYRKAKFTNFADLDKEFTKIKKFVDILYPLLTRMSFTQIGDISPTLKR